MAFLKCMRHIRQIEFYFLNFIWSKWGRSFKTVSEFTSHDLASNEHLITTHWITANASTALLRCGVKITKIIRKHINDLYNKVCICSCYANCKICNNRSGKGQVFI